MSGPAILIYNMDNPRKLKLMFICSQLKLRMISVPKADYNQPIGALVGMHRRVPGEYTGDGFPEEMLVMVNFSNPLLNAFLGALRQNRLPGIALKAVLTPSNSEWDSVKLHDELLQEHLRMHGGKK